MRTGCKALLIVGLTIVDTPPATAASYSYTQIAAPGSNENNAAGINDSGVVAGYYLIPAGNTVVSHGFVFQKGVLTTIDPPGSGGTVISGIANDGLVIGYYKLGTTARVDAFILKNGTYTTFGMNGFDTYLTAVSRDGAAAGYSLSFKGERLTGLIYRHGRLAQRPVHMEAGYHLEPNAINDRGTTVGEYGPASYLKEKGFVFTNGTLAWGPGAGDTHAIPTGINDPGLIVGNLGNVGFISEGGTTRTFQVRGRQATTLTALNNSGDIVGDAYSGLEGELAFVLHRGAFSTLDPADAVSTAAAAINSSGQVAGTYRNSDGSQLVFLATPQ